MALTDDILILTVISFNFRLIYHKMVTRGGFDYTGYFTIVLTEINSNRVDLVKKILIDCWQMYITNVIVIANIETGNKCAIYSYFPFTPYFCAKVVPSILNYYTNNSFQYDINYLFPEKMDNLFGCPVTVATFQTEPHIILTERNDTTYSVWGIDGILLTVLSQFMHFKPVIRVPSDGMNRGSAYVNGTKTGALKMVIYSSIFLHFGKLKDLNFKCKVFEGEADITIGAFGFSKSRNEYLQYTNPYYYTPIIFALSMPRPYTSIEQLFFPFKYIIWSCIGAMFSIGLVVVVFLKYVGNTKSLAFVVGKRNRMPFMNMINTFFGGSIQLSPKRNFARYVFMIWMIGCIVLRNSYQGTLFTFLQQPKAKPVPSTLNELLEKNCTILASKTSYFLFENTPSFQKL